jgi:hypothetical protein
MPSMLATARSNKLPSKTLVSPTAEAQFLGSDGNPLVLPLEGSLVLQTPGNQRRFRLSVAGYGTSTGANTLTIKLYLGTSATIASNGTAFISTTVAMNSTNQNWFFDVYLNYDTQSNQVGGYYVGYAGLSTGIIDITAITSTSMGSFSDIAENQGITITGTCAGMSSHIVTCAEIIPE